MTARRFGSRIRNHLARWKGRCDGPAVESGWRAPSVDRLRSFVCTVGDDSGGGTAPPKETDKPEKDPSDPDDEYESG